MKYPCEMIRDLLPLYIDGVCSEASRESVDAHLSGCAPCRSCCEAMRTAEDIAKKDSDSIKLADGLMNLKKRVNRRFLKVSLAALALLVCVVTGKHVLFDLPLKELSPGDVQVKARCYAMEELTKLNVDATDDVSVRISKGDDDTDEDYRIVIPFSPELEFSMTESAIEGTDHITIMEWKSDYFLRDIRWHADRFEEGVLYVSSIKTTLLNNKVPTQRSTAMEMRRISKIVYVAEDGTETVMWEE